MMKKGKRKVKKKYRDEKIIERRIMIEQSNEKENKR